MRFLKLVCVAAIPVAALCQTWTLRSGPAEYRVRQQNKAVYLEYFGPAGGAAWRGTPADLSGLAEGQPLVPGAFELVSAARPGPAELTLKLRHARLPLEVDARLRSWGDTGVFTRTLLVRNTGTAPLRVESLPTLFWELPGGQYELTYLWGGWGQERQVSTERLAPGRRVFTSKRGRSSSIYSPWFFLRNQTLHAGYAAQLAWSGNWEMSFDLLPGRGKALPSASPLAVSLGMLPDFGGPLTLAPGTSRLLPEVAFTTTTGDLDDAANQLHRYQRRFVVPRGPNSPLQVQFNSWYPFPGNLDVAELKRCADVAAELGAEVFVLDSGWYSSKDWSRELGDYVVNRKVFPNGLEELSSHVRERGMKFGIWVEIENAGVNSQLAKEHPDWLLQYNHVPLLKGVRYHLNFANPEVRRWARAVVDRLVSAYGIEWIKIDYNIDVGAEFDPSASGRTGDTLTAHIESYYGWLDEIRAAHPKLLIENCASGGLRLDLGIIRRTHTTWLSDVVEPLPSVQLAYGCTLEFTPQVCNHWMVGDTDRGVVDLGKPEGWWDFMLRVPMNGQYGISSRVFDWNAGLKARAAANVTLYKKLRALIAEADVYHLTPPPDHNAPTGWMALQYVGLEAKRSALLAYRLAQGERERVFRPRGLAPEKIYAITVDGKSAGARTGRQLMDTGIAVALDAEFRAAVIEFGDRPATY